ncbi:MAG: hypothetical protein ACKERG_00560 [Candidatus Hodgkinia cicadicola]
MVKAVVVKLEKWKWSFGRAEVRGEGRLRAGGRKGKRRKGKIE